MITLVSYGLGNVQAFANIYRRLNIRVQVARTADELAGAERIIEFDFDEDERSMFQNSVDAVKGLVEACKGIDPTLA